MLYVIIKNSCTTVGGPVTTQRLLTNINMFPREVHALFGTRREETYYVVASDFQASSFSRTKQAGVGGAGPNYLSPGRFQELCVHIFLKTQIRISSPGPSRPK